MTSLSTRSSRSARLLLLGCSSLALCGQVAANEVLFSDNRTVTEFGERSSQAAGWY
jgi:hypothetical protein